MKLRRSTREDPAQCLGLGKAKFQRKGALKCAVTGMMLILNTGQALSTLIVRVCNMSAISERFLCVYQSFQFQVCSWFGVSERRLMHALTAATITQQLSLHCCDAV